MEFDFIVLRNSRSNDFYVKIVKLIMADFYLHLFQSQMKKLEDIGDLLHPEEINIFNT